MPKGKYIHIDEEDLQYLADEGVSLAAMIQHFAGLDIPIIISERGLKHKLKQAGIRLRHVVPDDVVKDLVFLASQEGGETFGAQAIYGTLSSWGHTISLHRIKKALRELDPEGRNSRQKEFQSKRASIHRGTYYGEYFGWSVGMDQNEKGVSYCGLFLFGAVDNTSRYCLEVQTGLARSSIQGYRLFRYVVENYGCFDSLSTDCGAENVLNWTAQEWLLEEVNRFCKEKIEAGELVDSETGQQYRILDFEGSDGPKWRVAVLVGPSYSSGGGQI